MAVSVNEVLIHEWDLTVNVIGQRPFLSGNML